MSTQLPGSSLDPSRIQQLLKKGRTRGDYEGVIRAFLESSEAGIEVPLDSGPFAGKTGEQVKIGLDNARKRVDGKTGQPAIEGGHALKVIKEGNSEKNEEQHVYLIDTRKVEMPEGAEAEVPA
jgi:hypothetical protein